MTTCGGSRSSRRFSAALPTRPEQEDVRLFQLHLASNGAGTPKINATVSALRFFFDVTLERADLARPLASLRQERTVPVILSPEEVARFLEAAPSIKYKAALSVLWGGAARFRSRLAQGFGYQFQAHDVAGRAGQRPQGSPRHALTGAARTVARLVSYRPPAGLALSRSRSRFTDDVAPAHARLPEPDSWSATKRLS